jgi:hypothetical protein
MGFMFAARLCACTAFNCVFTYTAELYPTSLRSTGVGTASAMSRLAGFVTTFVAADLSVLTSGIIYSLASYLAVVMLILIPYETLGRPMFNTLDDMLAYEKKEDGIHKIAGVENVDRSSEQNYDGSNAGEGIRNALADTGARQRFPGDSQN